MPLTEARLTQSGGMRGLQAASNRVLQNYVTPGAVTLPDTFDRAALGTEYITNSVLTDWQIVSSTVRAIAIYESDWLLWANPVGADIEVSGSFDVDGTVNQGASNLIARSTSTVSLKNGVAAQLLGGTWTAPQDHLWLRLISIANDAESVLGTYDLGVLTAPLTTQTITLRCAGDQLSVLYGGTVVIGPVTHSTYQTNTYAGFRIYDGDHAGQHRLREFNAQPYVAAGALYSDDFNRANAALVSPWVTIEGTHNIVSNKVTVGPLSPNTSYYNQTFAPDQWAEGDMVWDGGSGGIIVPTARVNGNDYYYYWANGANIVVSKRVGGVYNFVSGTSLATVSPSFKARIEVEGTTIRAYKDGVLAFTGTDTDIATGRPGILSANGEGQGTLDNWRGGDLPYTPLYVGYRTFTGDDYIELAIAESSSEDFLQYSIFTMARTSADVGGVGKTWAAAGSASTLASYWYLNHSQFQEIDASGVGGYTAGFTGTGLLTADGWCVIGNTMGAQGATPVLHRYKVSTATWAHENAGGALGATTPPGGSGRWRIGNNNTADEPWYGDIAAVVFFNRVLTTAEVERLSLGLDAWLSLSPVHCWRLDQTTITDLVGNADQTSITGPPPISGYSPLRVTTPVYADDFNRADGAGWGSNWQAVSGTWAISSNRGVETGAVNGASLWAIPASTNQYAQSTVTTSTSGEIYPAIICSNGAWDNGYELFVLPGVEGYMEIQRNRVNVTSGSSKWTHGARVFKLQKIGAVIKAYVDGVEALSYTDSTPLTGTRFGVGIPFDPGPGANWDNFRGGDVSPLIYTDDFNRADAATLGSNWTVANNAIAVVSGHAQIAASNCSSWYSAATFPPTSHWAEGKMRIHDGQEGALGPSVRQGLTASAYYSWIRGPANPPTFEIWREYLGYTQIGGYAIPVPAAKTGPVTIAVEVDGTTIRGYVEGVKVIEWVETDPANGPNGSAPGINGGLFGASNALVQLDDYRCGPGRYPGLP